MGVVVEGASGSCGHRSVGSGGLFVERASRSSLLAGEAKQSSQDRRLFSLVVLRGVVVVVVL